MKKRVILANTLMVLGAILALSGLAALALWQEYEKSGSHELASLLYLLKAYNPPDVWVPVLSHLGAGASLMIYGEKLRRQAVVEGIDERKRMKYFQNT